MKKQAYALSTVLMLSLACSVPAHASWTQHVIDGSFPNACDVVARDLDGDGDPDAAGLSANGTVNWYENDGNQVFTEHLAAQGITNGRYLRAGDLDGDNDLDLIVACWASYGQPGGLYRLMNTGATPFTVVRILPELRFYDIAVLDLDGDLDPDLVGIYSMPWDENLSWWENTDNGQTFIEHIVSTNSGPCFGVGDMDNDGDLDLLGKEYPSILWFENNENQTFARHLVGATPLSSLFDLSLGDLDGDGDMDVLAGTDDLGIVWYHNDGNQIFSQVSAVPGPPGIDYVQVMDVDGDGCMDISCMSWTWGYVRWIENFLCRNFDDHTISQSSVGTVSYDTCDFNGDGRVDFAVTGTMTSNNIQWYENSLAPTAKFQIAPVNQPIIIPPQGGEFSFDVWFWNTTSDPLPTDLWTSVQSEEPFIDREPIMLIEDIPLAPNSLVCRRLTQRVPAFAPPIGYYYEVKIGDFPLEEFDYPGGFYFAKDSGDCVTAPWQEDCLADGWESVEISIGGGLPETPQMTIHPNPFNPKTAISFELRNPSFVKLAIYDISGRLVATLVDGWREAGSQQVTWDASELPSDASELPSGVYLYRLELSGSGATPTTKSGKMILLK